MNIFPTEENVNIQTSIKFQNLIDRNDASAEQRIVEHKNPVRSFTFFKNINKSSDIETLKNFHVSVKGSKESFLYLDKSDYTANYSGIYSYGCLYPNANGSIKNFQLCKFYFIEENNHYRAITQPIANSIILKQGATILSGWNSGDNGIITFSNAPSSGLIVAQFSFYVPVRFESDKFEDKLVVRYSNNQKIFSLEKLTVTEIKLNPFIDPDDRINLNINHTFQLDLYKGSITTAQYDTDIESQSSGFEERKQKQEDPLFLFKLQDRRTLQQKDLDYLIALYLCSKGEGCQFNFIDKSNNQPYFARFNNSSLNYINQSANRIYQIQGLELRIFIEGLKQDNGYNGWQGNLLTLCQIFTIKNVNLEVKNIYIGFTSATGQFNDIHVINEAIINNNKFIGTNADKSTIILNGDATFQGEVVQLTRAQNSLSGSCFLSDPVQVADFEVYFNYSIYGGNRADGIAFIITTNGTSTLSGGEGIGYANTQKSVAVEIDTFKNDIDPNNNHIGINVNGNMSSVAVYSPEDNLRRENGNIWINYSIVSQTLSVYFSLDSDKPELPVLSYQLDLFAIVDPEEYGDFRFTTHDRDLTIDGKVYKSDKTLSPSALETKIDLSVDNQEIRGVVSLDISEDLIFANHFKNAELISAVIDWRNLPANLEAIPDRDIQYGVIGEIRTNGTFFIFEYLTKAASLLRAGRVRKINPNCPYDFTDEDCKVSAESVTYTTTVGIVRNRRSFFINQLESNLSFGRIKFLSGENKGIIVSIYDVVDTNRVILYTLLPFTPQDGDRIEVKKGCRKTPNDCKDFDNYINYGGDEDLPGNDFYLATPIRR